MSQLMPTVVPSPATAADLVAAFKRAWRGGTRPDVVGALREHPSLLKHRTLVIDLAYEEYYLRDQAGQAPDADAFCRAMPAFRSDVREAIRGHHVLADHPELFDRLGVEWPEPGEAVEGCPIVRELGRGAFARAYLATDPGTGDRPVVLKLSPTPSGEARTLGPTRHPHVAEVLWARQVGGLSVLCLRYAGAATLRDAVAAAFEPLADAPPTGGTMLDAIAIAGEGLPPADPVAPVVRRGQSYGDAVAAIGVRLADALAYLHARGINHGDLKPSNVVLAPGGHPYLIDFNLAGAAGESLHRYGGTMPYMAPERVRRLLGDSSEVGPGDRADVYAFGAVLYEALSGRVPIEPIDAPDLRTVAANLVRRQAAGVRPLVAAGVPGGLSRLVGRCLAVDPAARPPMMTVRRALDRFVRRRARRGRLALALAGVTVVTATGGWVAERRPVEEPAVATATIKPELRPPETPDDFVARGMKSLAAGDSSGAAVYFGEAQRLRPDGRTAALLGYIQQRAADPRSAAALYMNSIAQYGLQEAWVYNNLAYALSRPGATRVELESAVEYASAAIRLEPNLSTAALNRATARYWIEFDPTTAVLRNPQQCIADVETALQLNPRSLTVQFTAAQYFAAAGPAYQDRAIGCLREAVRLGRPTANLERNLVFRRHLAGRSDFKQILASGQRTDPADDRNPYLAEPPR